MNFFERIEALSDKKNSLLCVGLDPRAKTILELKESTKRLIDQTIAHTVCYKPNIAFYEAHGAEGYAALLEIIAYIDNEVPVLLDAKRGDIGATAEAYASSAFEHFAVDAITLSPYMGKSSAEPFFQYNDKGFFFLCRTSNPGAGKIQDKLIHSKPLYLEIAEEVLSWSPNAGLVVAGNDYTALEAVRSQHPDAWFLSPGIGAQGGVMETAIKAGMRADAKGILPVVVRAIANADNPTKAASDYVDALNKAREKALSQPSKRSISLKDTVIRGLIDTECFKTGKFTLKSGIQSPFYIDLRRASSNVRLHTLLAKAYAAIVDTSQYDSVAGIPVAALPLATAFSLETGLPLIYPRMTAKQHGTGNLVEGNWKKGDKVLLLDDLITTGKSKLEAVEILRSSGLVVDDLVVLIERGMQGRRDMETAEINLKSFIRVEEIFDYCAREKIISESDLKTMYAFIKEN